MDLPSKYITPDIKLSCYNDKLLKTEVVFEHHMLVWFISGETRIIQADTDHVYRAGDIFLIPRNQLATVIMYAKDGLPCKSVAMHLPVLRLRHFYTSLPIKPLANVSQKIRVFSEHPLLKSCMASLIPYFDI